MKEVDYDLFKKLTSYNVIASSFGLTKASIGFKPSARRPSCIARKTFEASLSPSDTLEGGKLQTTEPKFG